MSGTTASSPPRISTRGEDRLRRFMLWLAIALAVGTVVELWLMKHWGDRVQLVPFVLCGLLGVSTATAIARPGRRVIIVHRCLLGVVAAGSLFGIYEHIEHGLIFEREIRPTEAIGDVLFDAIRGAHPVAPGALAVAAVLGWVGVQFRPDSRE